MTNQVYKYRATAKGTLSSPYRFFKEGDIVTSAVPLEHPALIDASLPIPRPSKVIVPFMTINGVKQRPDHASVAPVLSQDQVGGKGVPTVAAHEAYTRSMDGVRAIEELMDGAPAQATDPEAELKQGGAGTGNQNVI